MASRFMERIGSFLHSNKEASPSPESSNEVSISEQIARLDAKIKSFDEQLQMADHSTAEDAQIKERMLEQREALLKQSQGK